MSNNVDSSMYMLYLCSTNYLWFVVRMTWEDKKYNIIYASKMLKWHDFSCMKWNFLITRKCSWMGCLQTKPLTQNTQPVQPGRQHFCVKSQIILNTQNIVKLRKWCWGTVELRGSHWQIKLWQSKHTLKFLRRAITRLLTDSERDP